MKNQQLRSMLYQEGLGISLKSTILSVILGCLSGYGLCYLGGNMMSLKFISFQFSVYAKSELRKTGFVMEILSILAQSVIGSILLKYSYEIINQNLRPK